eukprot:3045_1
MSFSGNRTLCAVIGFLVAVALATIAYRTIYRADVDNTASVDQDRNNLVNAVSVSQGLAKSGGSDESGASIKTELHIDPIVPNDQVDQGANVVQPADDGKSNVGEEPIVDAGLPLKSGGSDESGASIKTELHIDPIVPNDQVDQGANVVQPTDDGKSNDGEEPIVDADQENSKKVFKSVETNFDHSFEVVGPPKEQSEFVVPPE